MTSQPVLQLEFSTGRPPLTALAEINGALCEVGSHVAPLDLKETPPEISQLLAKPALNDTESQRVQEHFLLPRNRLLEVIAAAGRQPQVAGGGELSTYLTTHDYSYPQLWIVQDGIDYSRFDRFHVNRTGDGTGADEVLQLLAGGGIRVLVRLPDESVMTLTLSCPHGNAGWLITYDGGRPHIGSLSQGLPGTKLLTQVIGPPSWEMQYVDEN